MDLTDKVAVVTGAASGIGAAIVGLYLEAGAKVVAVDLDPRLPEVAGRSDRVRCVGGDVAEGQEPPPGPESALTVVDRLARSVVGGAVHECLVNGLAA